MGIFRNYDNRLSIGERVNPLIILIAISMIIFVVLAFFKAITYVRFPEGADVIAYFDKNILGYFALSSSFQDTLHKPWTLLVCSSVETSIWALVADMLWLWCFGSILIDLTGYKKIIPLFIYASVVAASGYLATCHLLAPPLNEKIPFFYGASASIMGIAVACTMICPHYKLLPMLNGGISLWIITLVYAVINFATIPAGNAPMYVAQLAGGFSGFLYIFLLRRGWDGTDWMNQLYEWFINLFNPDKHTLKQKIKSSYYYNTDTDPFKKTPNLTQQRLDEILDKINYNGGYEKLTPEEKEFLKRASQEDLRDR